MTKEARLEKAQQIKSTHFQLGYPRSLKTVDPLSGHDEEVMRQKWNPTSVLAKGNLAKSNWTLGSNNTFGSTLTQNRSDYQNHGAHFDPNAKAKRLELAQELRKSNLPAQHFDFPKSTAQESFAQSKSKEDDTQAMKQRKEYSDKIVARQRPAKPNFTLGTHKLDYLSENKGSLKQPTEYVFNKETRDLQVATQRQHNFKMSFEQGNQFETDKGTNQPYKLPAESAGKDRVFMKGASNLH